MSNLLIGVCSGPSEHWTHDIWTTLSPQNNCFLLQNKWIKKQQILIIFSAQRPEETWYEKVTKSPTSTVLLTVKLIKFFSSIILYIDSYQLWWIKIFIFNCGCVIMEVQKVIFTHYSTVFSVKQLILKVL